MERIKEESENVTLISQSYPTFNKYLSFVVVTFSGIILNVYLSEAEAARVNWLLWLSGCRFNWLCTLVGEEK